MFEKISQFRREAATFHQLEVKAWHTMYDGAKYIWEGKPTPLGSAMRFGLERGALAAATLYNKLPLGIRTTFSLRAQQEMKATAKR